MARVDVGLTRIPGGWTDHDIEYLDKPEPRTTRQQVAHEMLGVVTELHSNIEQLRNAPYFANAKPRVESIRSHLRELSTLLEEIT